LIFLGDQAVFADGSFTPKAAGRNTKGWLLYVILQKLSRSINSTRPDVLIIQQKNA